MDIYQLASAKADEIESELKRLSRWSQQPLPDEAFEDMGAFGSNTMSFEHWLQFVLIPRIREIVDDQGDFPVGSYVASYAMRYFDGDSQADTLLNILHRLDELINSKQESTAFETEQSYLNYSAPTVTLGDTTIPDVLFSVAESLPQFTLIDLENQLQTFDTFLNILSPTVRPAISEMLSKAANQTINQDCKRRLERAAQDIADGKRATPDYPQE
jgi:uncharacterized protein YqcC (DUF446 family)